ncbi:MAG TPA: hypothetical protein DDW49_02355 [Deltaproteobacteria bacterium]|nr:MAG: hypothetical protein A2048_06685 [Deltaproteobacteria bacterium GWA2_45_12]HBF12226.1 hypothetical protein [Deltaproteobacteria bacterium]
MVRAKKSVEKLVPYISGKNTSYLFEHSTKVMKLDSNELSITPSPRVSAVLVEFVQKYPLNWYPDISCTTLHEKLAEYVKYPTSFIQTFNGSDHGLETICKAYLEPGDEVVIAMPTYDHFRVYAQACDATIKPVFGDTLTLPSIDKLIEAITEKAKIIYIVNPLTQSLYSKENIETLLKTASKSLVIVDEAYFEFCNATVACLIKNHPHLIISRSFSKAFGLAGLRCGYLLAQPETMAPINKVRLGKINSLTQVAACAALDDVEYTERSVFEIKTAREWITPKLKNLGLFVVDTMANYLFVEVAKPLEVARFLEKHDVFIRSGLTNMDGFLRITIGHQLLMERFWQEFKKIPAELLYSQTQVQAQGRTGSV